MVYKSEYCYGGEDTQKNTSNSGPLSTLKESPCVGVEPRPCGKLAENKVMTFR